MKSLTYKYKDLQINTFFIINFITVYEVCSLVAMANFAMLFLKFMFASNLGTLSPDILVYVKQCFAVALKKPKSQFTFCPCENRFQVLVFRTSTEA